MKYNKNKFTKKTVKRILLSGLLGGLLLTLGACATLQSGVNAPYQKKPAISQAISQPQKINTVYSIMDDLKTTLIVLSSHFDDAALSVGDIIYEFDGPKYIVTFFSTPTTTPQYLTWWDEKCGFKKSTDAREVREQENIDAANIFGARIFNKNYVDNQYETRSESDNDSLVKAITKDIEQIIESTNNTQLIIMGPSYFGDKKTHADHLLVSKAFMQAITNEGYANAPFYFKNYTDPQFYFYEDLPYTNTRFSGGEVKLDSILTNFYTGLQLNKKEIAISDEAFKSKIEGIRAYSSQINALNGDGKGIIEIITDFEMNRCPQAPLPPKPFEVIYEIMTSIDGDQ